MCSKKCAKQKQNMPYTCRQSAHSWQSWYLVVHHGGYMELKHLDVFLNDVRCSSVLLVPDELLVGFHNVC